VLLNLFFGPFALGDVADDAYNKISLIGSGRAYADFRGELTSILPSADQIRSSTHWPYARPGAIDSAMSDVRFSEPLRQQNLHGLAEQLNRVVAEQLLSLRVSQCYGAIRIHDHNGIRRGRQKVSEYCFVVIDSLYQGFLFSVEETSGDAFCLVSSFHISPKFQTGSL